MNFSRADLSLGNFRLANLKRANLSGVPGLRRRSVGHPARRRQLHRRDTSRRPTCVSRARSAPISRGANLAGADLANADLSEAKFKKTKIWGATARRAKPPKGWGVLLAVSTMFSKAKEKKTKVADKKEEERQKRIADLEAEADQKPPHLTGRR